MAIIDISKIEPPSIIDEPNFEDKFNDLKQKLIALDPNLAPVLELESEPLTNLLQIFAYELVQTYKQVNYTARASFIAFAEGANLDFLALNANIKRAAIEKDGKIIGYENDNDFRLRVQQAWESKAQISTKAKISIFIRAKIEANIGINVPFALKTIEYKFQDGKYTNIDKNLIEQSNHGFNKIDSWRPGDIAIIFLVKDLNKAQLDKLKAFLDKNPLIFDDLPAVRFYPIAAFTIEFKKISIEYWLKPNTPNDFSDALNIKLNTYCKNSPILGKNVYASDIIEILKTFANIADAKVGLVYTEPTLELAKRTDDHLIKLTADQCILTDYFCVNLPPNVDNTKTPPKFEIYFRGYEV